MRNILITGASRGIGNAIAKKLMKDGHNISLGLRNLNTVKGTILDPKLTNSKNILLNYYEATDTESIKDWINNTHSSFGKIDTLIHCAGIIRTTGFIFKDHEYRDIKDLWDINVMGTWYLSRSIWEDLEQSGKGRIQVLVSMSGIRSKGKLAAYSMSKFGQMSLCHTMKNIGWDKGIRVTAICPGWVNTEMSKDIKSIEKKEMIQVEDIALLSSTILKLPNSSVPFNIPINCLLENF
mgnify:CR=1 FL=1